MAVPELILLTLSWRGSMFNNTIKTKAHRDAVWDYMSFGKSYDAEYINVKNYVEAGFAKFLAPRRLKKFGFERYIKEIPEEWLNTYEVAMASGKAEPYQKGCKVIYLELQPALQKAALYDTLDYQAVLDEVAASVNNKILGIVAPE